MREISQILYSPLKEEDRVLTGWSKSTIEYVQTHKAKVHSSIRGIAKGITGTILQKADVDNIYQDVLVYMHKADDYNISKAYERSSTGTIVSLEGYVHSLTKCCVRRYLKDKAIDEANTVPDIQKNDEGKEYSKSDEEVKEDRGYENICYQLQEVCRSYESQRYAFGPDLFQIWFVRLLATNYNLDNKYIDILTALGVSKSDLTSIQKEARYDGAMLSIAKAVSTVGTDIALEVIRDFTYSASKIQQVVEIYKTLEG